MLILPIKKKCFDMIVSGEKKEEYREIKPYYDKCLGNAIIGFPFTKSIIENFESIREYDESQFKIIDIIFKNGYKTDSPKIKCKCKLRIGQGKQEWGAEKRKEILYLGNFGGVRRKMRYLINNKIYDTETSEKIITYIKQIPHDGLFITTYPKYRHTLYKTKKGQFFVHIGEYVGKTDVSYCNKDYIELISEDEVKGILNALNDIEKYQELFDDIEEG